MANVRHSRNLFTRHDGGPMCFSLIPCAERKEIREMIEYGGGMLVQPGVNPNAIKLVPTGSTAATDCNQPSYSTEFVRECAKRDLLLPLKNFNIDLPRSSPEDVEDESGTTCRAGALRSIRIRTEFSLGEDISIAKFMAKERGLIRGNEIYKRLERSGVAGKHTWQSLKERYLKKIYPMRHLFESPASDQPAQPRANARVARYDTPLRPHVENRESLPQGSQDVPGTSGSMVTTPRAATNVEGPSTPAVSTCSSQVVPETEYDALCDTSSYPQDSPEEWGSTQPFVPTPSRTTDDVLRAKPPVHQGAAQDINSTEPFVPCLSLEEDISTKSPLQTQDNTPSCEFDGGTEPFVVANSGGEAEEVTPRSDSSEAPVDSSETVVIETPTDGSSERSSISAPSPLVRGTSSKQGPHSQRDGRWPTLSGLCYSPGDLEVLQGKLTKRSSQNAPGSLEDLHLALLSDFPSDSQVDQPTLEPDPKMPDARSFTEYASHAPPGASQSGHNHWTRTGVVSGQRRLPSSAKDSEREFSLRKTSTACSGASLAQSSQIPSLGCHAGSQPTSDGTFLSSDEYETATSKSGSPRRAAVDSLLDLLVVDSPPSPMPKVKIVSPIVSSKPQQRSQQVPVGHKGWSPSLLDDQDCEVEGGPPQLSALSDMSLTIGAQAGEVWDRSRDLRQPRSPCRSDCRGASSPETTLEDSEMECEQPSSSGMSLPGGTAVAQNEDDDFDSCDDIIVRKQRIGRPVRAVAIVSCSDDDDEDAAAKRPKPLDKEMLEQHQRNVQLMLRTRERIEKKWRKQRPHKQCPPDCSCPQSPYYATLLRLLVRTRAILAFHDSLDADSRARATALVSELVEQHRSGDRPELS